MGQRSKVKGESHSVLHRLACNRYSYKQIFEAVKAGLGGKVNPAVQCVYDDDHELHAVSQINVCLDKSLQLTDCDPIKVRRRHMRSKSQLLSFD